MGERAIHIAPQFAKEFPELASKFEQLGISVWFRAKAGRKTVPEMETIDGVPLFYAGVGSDRFQLTFKYKNKGKEHFTRPDFIRSCEKVLKQVRADRKVIAGLTLRQRYERLRDMGKNASRPDAKFLDDLRQHRSNGWFQTVGEGSGDELTMCVDRHFGPKSATVRLWGHGEAFSCNTWTVVGKTPPFSWERLDEAFDAFELKHHSLTASPDTPQPSAEAPASGRVPNPPLAGHVSEGSK